MKFLQEVEIERWKSFLGAVPEPNIFQTPEMREVYAGTRNYEPVVVAEEKNGRIASLALGHIVKEGEGIKGAFSSRAIVTGGPLSTEGDIGGIMAAFDKAVKPRALYTQIRNLRDMSAHRKALEGIGYEFESHLNFIHDLTRPTEEIFAGFSEGRRKGIRKAEERGVQFVEGRKEDLAPIYEMVFDTYKEVGVPLADASLFESAWKVLRPLNMIHSFVATMDDDPVAGRIVLCYNGVLHDWYAGGKSSGKGQNANELLVWSIMRWGREHGYRLFDFGGAGRPGEKYGPGEFKRRFGGTLTNYGRFQIMYHPLRHIVGRKGYEMVRKLR